MAECAIENKAEASPQAVQEFVDSRGQRLRSDTQRGVLRGVKLLGLRSRNQRTYKEEALRKAIGLYEGAKVNVNHPERDPMSPRDYRDRLGVVRNVRYEPSKGLFGDLHYNPKHALSEQLTWDAEHAPENVGFSHNVLAKTRHQTDGLVVEEITRVQSVDLVADPATTAGLFEQEELAEAGSQEQLAQEQAQKESCGSVSEAMLQENTRLKEEAAQLKRRLLIESLLKEHTRVDASDIFLEQLRSAADEQAVVALIEDRASLIRSQSAEGLSKAAPVSLEQELLSTSATRKPANDVCAFVASLRRTG